LFGVAQLAVRLVFDDVVLAADRDLVSAMQRIGLKLAGFVVCGDDRRRAGIALGERGLQQLQALGC
jgi:hypothetical protein